MLRLLDALDTLMERPRLLVSCGELVPRLHANLGEGRLGPVELADEMVDSRLSADVLGAELGQPALAVLDVGLLGGSLLRAFAEVGLALLEIAIDGVQLSAALVEDVDGAAEDVPFDAAPQSLAETGVGVGHAALDHRHPARPA